MRVLVTDGDNRAALAVTRSLGRAGHEVIVGARQTPALAQSSRYCALRVWYPDPTSEPDRFIDAMTELARTHHINCVMPISDITTLLVTGHRERFEPACAVPFARADIVERAADKVDILQTAARLGVPVPRSVVLTSPDRIPNHGLDFPLVVKPWRSRIRTPGGWASTSVSHASDPDALRRDLDARRPHEFPVILQERIEGPGVGVFACYDRGQPIALFGHRRLRERPPWGGVSVLCESIELPAQTRDHATQLLGAIGWQGIAMVEFKVDRRDGQPKLMEINGRFWGSLQLAIDSGVDFPVILLRTVDASHSGAQMSYRIGVRSRWLCGDFDSLLQTLRPWKGPTDLRPSRIRSVLQFMRFLGADLHYDNPKWDDPRPFAVETFQRLHAVVQRARGIREASASSSPRVVKPAAAPGRSADGL
jgi:predicted ATP-grasp superfamily ATP-dependent carboligase